MSSSKKSESLKVFRITLFGRAEAGKTTLCTQFIANGYSARYEHTENPHMYYREMKPKDISSNTEFASSSSNADTGHGKQKNPGKKPKKNKKAVLRYGVQLEDIPGEINEEVIDDSVENEIIERTKPQDYYDMMIAEEEYINEYGNVEIDEKSALLGKEKVRRAQRNRLYGPTLTHGCIIVYDVGSKPSFTKALALHKMIRTKPDKHKIPIYFLGNKLDASKPSAMEVIDKVAVYCKGSNNTEAATGSLSRNEIHFQDKIMTSADFVNSIIQNLNKNNLFMTESDNDRKDKRNKKKQGDGANDDGSSIGCFGCCSSSTNKNERYDNEGVRINGNGKDN
eukprot:g2138.t1